MDDACYARIAGSDMVYQIDGSVRDALLYTTQSELLPDEVLLMDWDTVDSIDITLDGATYHVERSTTEETLPLPSQHRKLLRGRADLLPV